MPKEESKELKIYRKWVDEANEARFAGLEWNGKLEVRRGWW